jgi:hypothetical protein
MEQPATSKSNVPVKTETVGNMLTIQATPIQGQSWADMMDEDDEEMERMHNQTTTSKLNDPVVIRTIGNLLNILATPLTGFS